MCSDITQRLGPDLDGVLMVDRGELRSCDWWELCSFRWWVCCNIAMIDDVKGRQSRRFCKSDQDLETCRAVRSTERIYGNNIW